LVTDKDFLELT